MELVDAAQQSSTTVAEEPDQPARPDPAEAEIEVEFRRLLVHALREDRLDHLLCEHEAEKARRSWITFVPLLAISALLLTFGFFVSYQLGLPWWGYPLVCGGVFLVLSGIAGLVALLSPLWAQRAATALVIGLVGLLPLSVIIQADTAGFGSLFVTHVSPSLVLLAGVLGVALVRRATHGVRLFRLVRHMPFFFLATLGVLLIPLYTAELWLMFAEMNLSRGLVIFGVLVGGIAVLTAFAWRTLSQPQTWMSQTVERLVRKPTSEAAEDALDVLRGLAGSRDELALLGEPFFEGRAGASGARFDDLATTTLNLRPRRLKGSQSAHLPHSHVGAILANALETDELTRYANDFIRPRLKALFGGRHILGRLLVFAVGLSLFVFVVLYLLAVLTVDTDVGRRWSSETIPHRELLGRLGIEVAFPLGPYALLPALLALTATVVALTFVLTSGERRAIFMETLLDEIRRCLLVAIPYYRLPTNDALERAQSIGGFRGAIAADNCRSKGREENEPQHAGQEGGHSLWYRWIAPTSGTVTFTTEGSLIDTLLAVYTGSSFDNFALVMSNDDVSEGYWSSVTFEAKSGVEYTIAVDGYGGEKGPIVLGWVLPPGNDNFEKAETIRGPSGDVHGACIAGMPVWYRWQAPDDGQGTFTTEGSTFDTVLTVYSGLSADSLEVLETNDDAGLDGTSRVDFHADEGAVYTISVEGNEDAEGEILLHWRLELPPANDRFDSAAPLEGFDGSATTSTVGASKEPGEPDHARTPGGASVWYRWEAPADGEVTISILGSSFYAALAVYTGATVDTLQPITSNADPSGTSRVRFNATRGTQYHLAVDGVDATTGQAVLGWQVKLPPRNDSFDGAEQIAGARGKVHGENHVASREQGEPDHANGQGGASVWYRWEAPLDGPVTMTTAGSTFDTVLAVYTGATLAELSEVESNDDAPDAPLTSKVTFDAVAGTHYSIAVDGYRGATGQVVLNWGFPPAHDAFESAETLHGAGGGIEAVTVGATKEPGEPAHAGNPGGASVWYRWEPPGEGRVTMTTVGSAFDTLLAVYTGERVDELTEVTSNDDAWVDVTSTVSFVARAGEVYAVAVDGFSGATGELVLGWELE